MWAAFSRLADPMFAFLRQVYASLAVAALCCSTAHADEPVFLGLTSSTINRIAECGGGIFTKRNGLRIKSLRAAKRYGLRIGRSAELRAAFMESFDINEIHSVAAFDAYTRCVSAREEHARLLKRAIDTTPVIEDQLRDNGVEDELTNMVLDIRKSQIEALKTMNFVEAEVLKADLTKHFVIALASTGVDFGQVNFLYSDDEDIEAPTSRSELDQKHAKAIDFAVEKCRMLLSADDCNGQIMEPYARNLFDFHFTLNTVRLETEEIPSEIVDLYCVLGSIQACNYFFESIDNPVFE